MARSSTTYPRKWKSRETTVIRVPDRVADDLLRIARRLDESRTYALREDGNTLVLDVTPVKRVSYTATKPINVASVPQRSPFRYPGGKTWLGPRIRPWLAPRTRQQHGLRPRRPVEFLEPFVGGGIISPTVASEQLARRVPRGWRGEGVGAGW